LFVALAEISWKWFQVKSLKAKKMIKDSPSLMRQLYIWLIIELDAMSAVKISAFNVTLSHITQEKLAQNKMLQCADSVVIN